jgi:hypothetical protein
LPSARLWHSAKNFQKKKSLLSAADVALGKEAVRVDDGFFLPSADVALGKETFADKFFAECSLPSAIGALPSAPSTWQRARLQ